MKKNVFLILLFVMLVSISKVQSQNIPMTFHNGSFRSISLIIPGVMNPRLVPMSNSGVSLDAGQVVYFFPNGKNEKKEVLFVVKPTWKRDTILEIHQIIKKRVKELKIK